MSTTVIDERWLTLREAATEADVSLSALRKWYRSGAIRAMDENSVHGPRKLVAMSDVHRRIDAYREATAAAADTPPAPTGDPHAMVVPQEAWQRVMDQLGNLHETGQALAQASEAKAKAETTVEFLKERLADLRAALEAKEAALVLEQEEHRRVAEEVRAVLASTLKAQDQLERRGLFRRRRRDS